MGADQETEVTLPDVPYPKAVERFPEVRQSSLSAFDACALEAFFENAYRRGWSEHHQGRGQLWHRVAARCLREMHAAQENKIEVGVALAILDEVLAQDDADRECPACGSENILPGLTRKMERTCGACGVLFETEFVNVPRKHVRDLVWVTKKWAHENRFDIAYLVDVEKRLRASVHYSVRGIAIDRVLTGKLDALFLDRHDSAHAIVLDWKDTWGLPRPSEISEEGYFQQRFYAWLILRNYKGIERVTLREFYVRHSEPREASLWRHDLDRLDEELASLVRKFDRAFEQQVFVPSPGKHCGWCMRPQKCPIPTYARGEGRITSPTVAKQVAAQLILATRVKRQAEGALKAWVGENGPVEVKDAKGRRVYGFVDSERTDRPTEQQIDDAALRSGGTLSKDDVRRLYKTKRTTRFVDHAPEVPEEAQDKPLIDSLAASIRRAAERRGIT